MNDQKKPISSEDDVFDLPEKEALITSDESIESEADINEETLEETEPVLDQEVQVDSVSAEPALDQETKVDVVSEERLGPEEKVENEMVIAAPPEKVTPQAPVDVVPEKVIPTPPPVNDPPEVTSVGKPKSLKYLIIMFVAFMVLLVLIALGIWFFVINKKDDKPIAGDNIVETGCTYAAELVEDVALENTTGIAAKTDFSKSWKVKNIGTCDWKGDVQLVFVSGDIIGDEQLIIVADTKANKTAEISLDLVSPNFEGTYQAIWRLKENEINLFGDALPLTFKVKNPEAVVTSTPVPQADLIVTDLKADVAEVRQDVPFNIVATIKNQGGSNAVGFTVAWRSCAYDTCPYQDFPNLVTLTPGEVTTIQLPYTYTSWSTYTTDIKLDSSNKITESDESNNGRSFVIPVQKSLADLIIESITYTPATPTEGVPFTIKVAYRNIGSKAMTQNVPLQWWASTSAPAAACTLIVGNIAPGETKFATCTYIYPSWYGSIITKAVIDNNNEEPEISEANNSLEKTISVSKP
ncbi:MAG: CARDB domain-containing protein [bacterium]